MANTSWKAIRAAFAGVSKKQNHFPTVSIRPRLEALESRDTPNAFVLNTTDDTNDANLGDGKGLDANGNVSLRASIQEANFVGGDHTITYPLTGTDTEPPQAKVIALQSTVDQLKADITILGPGSDLLTVTRSKDGVIGIFSVPADAHVEISGLTITGGFRGAGQGNGGGIQNSGTLTVAGCTIRECAAPEGGAISNTGQLSVQGCTIAFNSATTGRGGGIVNTAKATIDQTTFTSNGASARGGAVASFLAASTCDITNSFFRFNSANDGGAVYLSDGTLNMTGGEVTDNVARAGGGGGVFGQGTITITGVNFYRNKASGNGGAILVNLPGTSSCTLQDCDFANNECNTGGQGGVGPNVAYDFKAPTVINCTGLNPNEPTHV